MGHPKFLRVQAQSQNPGGQDVSLTRASSILAAGFWRLRIPGGRLRRSRRRRHMPPIQESARTRIRRRSPAAMARTVRSAFNESVMLALPPAESSRKAILSRAPLLLPFRTRIHCRTDSIRTNVTIPTRTAGQGGIQPIVENEASGRVGRQDPPPELAPAPESRRGDRDRGSCAMTR